MAVRAAFPSLPYQLHTNRELGLMLAGTKPLANFSDGYGRFPEVVERYLRLFDAHVATGRLARRDFVVSNRQDGARFHIILFALPGEEWRIDAMIDLKLDLVRGRWTTEHERREGALLGYEDWQKDIWLAEFHRSER